MTSKPQWVNEDNRFLLLGPHRDGLRVWVQLAYELDGVEFYSAWIQGNCGRAYLRNGQGRAAVYSVEIAKDKAIAMSKHSVYLAKATGRLVNFEICPDCGFMQKVFVDPNNGVIVCSICEKPFFIPEPSSL